MNSLMRSNEIFWVMKSELANWRADETAALPQFFTRPCGDSVSVRIRIEEKKLRRHRADTIIGPGVEVRILHGGEHKYRQDNSRPKGRRACQL